MEIIVIYSNSRINLEGQLNINAQVSAYNKANNTDLFVDFRFNNRKSFTNREEPGVGHKLIEALKYNREYFEEEEFSSIINSIHTAVKYKAIESLSDVLQGYKDYEDFVELSSRNDNGVVCGILNKHDISILFGDGKALHNFRGYGFQLSGNLAGQGDCGSVYSHIISNMVDEYSEYYVPYFTKEIQYAMRHSSYGKDIEENDLKIFLKRVLKECDKSKIKELGNNIKLNKFLFKGSQFEDVKSYSLAISGSNRVLHLAKVFNKGIVCEGKGIHMHMIEFCMNNINPSQSISVLLEDKFGTKDPEILDSCYKVLFELFIKVSDIEDSANKSIADDYLVDKSSC